ncbi:pectate lyase [Pseudoxanthomonas mexicana]
MGAFLRREGQQRGAGDKPDSRRVARYEDIPRERRTGYEWYGSWPRRLLKRE